ncbi:hypothetical protein [Streptomyces sp. NPDC001933]|uniref:hypothetical protein n=1 Tax=Streptomyces sp. NPDC001933 TaxID=3364626 RepID=UPI003673CB89
MTTTLLSDPLSIYLNDHVTGAFGGAALARRMADTHPDSRRAAELRQLARDVEQDRDDLVQIMKSLAVPVRHYRTWLGLAGERIARLKPNGNLRHRSPLSDLIELESMRIGVEGKTALWQALRAIADNDPRLDRDDLDQLIQRAAEQTRTLNRWHQAVSAEVLNGRQPASGEETGTQ